jgi:hypothetical protein
MQKGFKTVMSNMSVSAVYHNRKHNHKRLKIRARDWSIKLRLCLTLNFMFIASSPNCYPPASNSQNPKTAGYRMSLSTNSHLIVLRAPTRHRALPPESVEGNNSSRRQQFIYPRLLSARSSSAEDVNFDPSYVVTVTVTGYRSRRS